MHNAYWDSQFGNTLNIWPSYVKIHSTLGRPLASFIFSDQIVLISTWNQFQVGFRTAQAVHKNLRIFHEKYTFRPGFNLKLFQVQIRTDPYKELVEMFTKMYLISIFYLSFLYCWLKNWLPALHPAACFAIQKLYLLAKKGFQFILRCNEVFIMSHDS